MPFDLSLAVAYLVDPLHLLLMAASVAFGIIRD